MAWISISFYVVQNSMQMPVVCSVWIGIWEQKAGDFSSCRFTALCRDTVCWILFKYYDQLECRNVGVCACVYFHFPRRARLISADESAIKNGSTIQRQSAHMVLLWLCYMAASLQNRQEHDLTSCSDHTARCVQHYFKPAAVFYLPDCLMNC